MHFPRCRSIPPSTRCMKHISIPCGPATYCQCKPSTKRHRSLSPQPHRLASPTRHQPKSRDLTSSNHTQEPPRPLHLSPITEITSPQPDNTSSHIPMGCTPPGTPSSPSPSHHPPPHRRPKRPYQELEQSPPSPAKYPRLRPIAEPRPTTRQPKRDLPESELVPSPPAKKIHTRSRSARTLGSKKRGDKSVARPGPSKKKTPRI